MQQTRQSFGVQPTGIGGGDLLIGTNDEWAMIKIVQWYKTWTGEQAKQEKGTKFIKYKYTLKKARKKLDNNFWNIVITDKMLEIGYELRAVNPQVDAKSAGTGFIFVKQ